MSLLNYMAQVSFPIQWKIQEMGILGLMLGILSVVLSALIGIFWKIRAADMIIIKQVTQILAETANINAGVMSSLKHFRDELRAMQIMVEEIGKTLRTETGSAAEARRRAQDERMRLEKGIRGRADETNS